MTISIDELKKLKGNEVVEKRENLISVINSFQERVKNNESLSEVERTSWETAIVDFTEVDNYFSTTQEGLMRRSQTATLGQDLSEVSNAVRSLSGAFNGNVKPAFENDPRFGYKTDNAFLLDVMNAVRNPDKATDQIKAVINAVGSDEYSRGNWQSAGVLIPDTMIDRIMSLTPEADFITPRCTSIPMGAGSVKIPCRVDKNHTTSVTGGTVAYRTKETVGGTKTKDKFETVSLEANEMIVEAAATKELLRFSPISIPSLIEASAKAACVDKRIDEALNGNGQGMPLGVLNDANDCLLSVDRTANQADTKIISGRDVIRMAMRVYGYDKAIWIANLDTFEILNTLYIADDAGTAGIIKLFSPVENGNGNMGTLWGRPIFFTEYAPGILTNAGEDISDWDDGLLSCVNFSEVLYGELYTEYNRSVHVRFSEREEVFQFVTSNDMRPWWKDVLTPKKGITTRSPCVRLTNTSVS